MKAIDLKTLLVWWNKFLGMNEKMNKVDNEEKPVQSTLRLKNFLNTIVNSVPLLTLANV